MRKLLELQANQIEAVLAGHRILARVWGGIVTPRFVRFQLTTPLGVRVQQVTRLSEEIALALGVPAARVYRKEGAIQVELPREEPHPVRLLPLCARLEEVPELTAVLGVDEEGVPLLVRLSSPEVAHVLVSGTTGSGKTALLRTILFSLALYNAPSALQMVLVDVQGRGLLALGGLPHLMVPVVQEVGRAVEVLGRVVAEMERRDRLGHVRPRLVVAIDELADVLQVGGKGVEEALLRLTQRGRKAGVHVVGCTQKPTAAVVGSVVKANFPLRLVGSVVSAEDARVAAGVGGSGAEKLLGRGDFVLVCKGQVVRFQAAWAGEEEIREWILDIGGWKVDGRREDEAAAAPSFPSSVLSLPASVLREGVKMIAQRTMVGEQT